MVFSDSSFARASFMLLGLKDIVVLVVVSPPRFKS